MRLLWEPEAWDEYLYWQTQDKKTLTRINKLLKDIQRDPMSLEGIGEPEVLKYDMSGCMSRRIDAGHRLTYTVFEDHILIMGCRGHYR